MGIQVTWENEAKTAIYLEFQRGWNWDELHTAIQKADGLITSVPHTVGLVIDIRNAGGLPRDFMTAAGNIFAQGEARPNEGPKIVIGAGVLIRAAYNGFVSVYGHHLKNRPFVFASNLEEAHAILETS